MNRLPLLVLGWLTALGSYRRYSWLEGFLASFYYIRNKASNYTGVHHCAYNLSFFFSIFLSVSLLSIQALKISTIYCEVFRNKLFCVSKGRDRSSVFRFHSLEKISPDFIKMRLKTFVYKGVIHLYKVAIHSLTISCSKFIKH